MSSLTTSSTSAATTTPAIGGGVGTSPTSIGSATMSDVLDPAARTDVAAHYVSLARMASMGLINPDALDRAAAGTAPLADNFTGQRDRQMDALMHDIVVLSARRIALVAASVVGIDNAAEIVQIDAQVAAKRREYNNVKLLDFLVNVARQGGFPPDVVNLLDTATIVVVPELQSDAAFAEGPPATIYVRQSVMDRMDAILQRLVERGVASETGGVRGDVGSLKAEYTSILDTIALLVHEQVHADEAQSMGSTGATGGPGETGASGETEDPRDGQMAAAIEAYEPWLRASGSLGAMGAAVRAAASQALMRTYVDLFELDAYAAQERFKYDELLKVDPERARSIRWLTLDADGNRLDRATALSNIVSYINRVAPGYAEYFVSEVTRGMDQPGWKSPGWKSPGWKSPGWKSPGWKSPGWLLTASLAEVRVPPRGALVAV